LSDSAMHNVRPINGRAGADRFPIYRRLYRRPGPLHWLVMWRPNRRDCATLGATVTRRTHIVAAQRTQTFATAPSGGHGPEQLSE
jgi:hypothetical protein